MADLDRLDEYLSSEISPENCMLLSDLDGFLHAMVCAPVEIEIDEWMRRALGCHPTSVPVWVIEEIGKLYAEILEGLLTEPPVVEPLFWEDRAGHVIAMDWCEGFMQGVALRPKEWLRLTESGKSGHLITPILAHLITDDGNSVLGIKPEDLDRTLDQAAEAIPEAVAGIFEYWRTPP